MLPKLQRILMRVLPLFFHKELKRAGELLPAEFTERRDRILRGMSLNQVMNLLEIFFYEKELAARPDFIRVSGTEHILPFLERKQGFILLSGHFGNWELLGYTLAKIGIPIHTIVRPQAINEMTEFMNSFRAKRGMKILMANNLSKSLKLLHQGSGIGIMSDLNARERGYQAMFFGRNASFYPTPVILSVRGNAPLIPVFIERNPDLSHVVRIEPPIEWQRGESMAVRIGKYVSRYESAIRRRPDQWVWFHERYVHADLGRIS